jgi:hypothetical protein
MAKHYRSRNRVTVEGEWTSLLLKGKLIVLNKRSVAKGPKFRPQKTKGALQNHVRQEKLAAKFALDLPKKGRKGGEHF